MAFATFQEAQDDRDINILFIEVLIGGIIADYWANISAAEDIKKQEEITYQNETVNYFQQNFFATSDSESGRAFDIGLVLAG